ncbi:MAG: hypothetical protein RBR32_03685 [Bacteroidales bacterium]|nr:hypothetical protein [Bacteroidales bacterium]
MIQQEIQSISNFDEIEILDEILSQLLSLDEKPTAIEIDYRYILLLESIDYDNVVISKINNEGDKTIFGLIVIETKDWEIRLL